MKTRDARFDDPDQVLNHIAEVAARTVIFDVESLVAFWDTDTATLDRGIASLLERRGDLTGVQVVVFATNSARRPTRTPNGQPQLVVYLGSASKPLRSKPYRGLPGPGLVVGDQVATDGLLARHLGYGFVHYQPRLPGTPRGPRAMRMLGRPPAADPVHQLQAARR